MKKVLILGAVLVLSTTFSSLNAVEMTASNRHIVMPILLGYQTNTSQIGWVPITVYVEYNPTTSTITGVTAQDQWSQDVGVVGYSGSLVNNGGILTATNFQVDLDTVTNDYVILNGSLTMV